MIVELKQALQHLSSEHPAVYKKFIRTLQPAPSDQPDVMRIYNSQVLNTPAPRPSYESQARVSHDVPSSLQTPLRVGPSSPRAPPRVVTDASPRPGLYAPYGTSATSRRPVSAPVSVHDDVMTVMIPDCKCACCLVESLRICLNLFCIMIEHLNIVIIESSSILFDVWTIGIKYYCYYYYYYFYYCYYIIIIIII